jgi:Uncharacterised nucleotidyltransferase
VRWTIPGILQSLSFQPANSDWLRSVPEPEWHELLQLTDRAQLTLPLAIRCGDAMPPSVRARVERDLANNAIRYARIGSAYRELAGILEARGVEFVVLKGLAQFPFYCDDPRHRPQYDIDLYCPYGSIVNARECAGAAGYEPVHASHSPATDHLPSMIRRSEWRWQGDYYDPGIPVAIELHHRFWDAATERFTVLGAGEFWERRTLRDVEGLALPALHPADNLTYSTWHLIKHLLRGDLRPCHVYELAHFLHRTAGDTVFWSDWSALAVSKRVVEAIAFRLAVEWFHCDVHPRVRACMEQLPADVNRWFELFRLSPALALREPNKDELFLHFCLVRNPADRLRIAARRIVPLNPPRYVLDANLPTRTLALTMRRAAFRAGFIVRRGFHHLRTLAPVLRSAWRWWCPS